MQPNTQVQDTNAQLEALRRRAQMPASSAVIGTEAANSLSPTNPIAAGGTDLMSNPQIPQGGAAGFPTDGAVGALKQQKGEAQTIIDAMIFRLRRLTDRGE